MRSSTLRYVRLVIAIAVVTLAASTLSAQSGPFQYFPLTPCRVVDTRNPAGVNGGPGLGTATRNFAIKGNCGVSATAKAISMNVTVTGATASSWLTIWPTGGTQPFVSTINFDPTDPALANGAIVGLGAAAQDLSVANAGGTVHVIIDVTGYFQ